MLRAHTLRAGGLLAMLVFPLALIAWEPKPVTEDPLLRMPGTQPGQASLEGPNRCTNCHEGYHQAVEPGFNWKGSMMAQSARDPLFWATFVVAAQDSINVLGNPNAADLCMRCHFPKGWLEGRSATLNASAMSGDDYDGVQCDFCHRMWDPHFDATYAGTREGSDWQGYWDEAGPLSSPAADATYNADASQAATIGRFNGTQFFNGAAPFSEDYTEAGSGQYFVSSGTDKRGSFADASARHGMLYSRFHKSKFMCATCHDVSNAVLVNLYLAPTADGSLPSETLPAYAYFHVERTFSEFMLSAYGVQGGAVGIGPFAPEVFTTSQPGNKIAACQDCHMRDGAGAGANKRDAVNRPGGSEEHPNSGQPIHDLTGGNVWIPTLLASSVSGSPNFDAVNAQLLGQGPGVLTMDLSQGLGLDPSALLAAAERARQQLQLAAAILDLVYDPSTRALSFKVQNQTGHKLISGFPEGRRMFVNVRAYGDDGAIVHEINPYDHAAGTLKGLAYPYAPEDIAIPAPLGSTETYRDDLVYEMKPSSELTGEDKTFHFVLGSSRYKDNRIPPRGFRIDAASERLSVPAWEGMLREDLFDPTEYQGGYDSVQLQLPVDASSIEVRLFYQTTSREYVEFLRNEIRGSGHLTLEPSAYIAQSDPFFAGLAGWGDTIWALWLHNRDVAGAAPLLMAQAGYGGGDSGGGNDDGTPCSAPAATQLAAESGANRSVPLSWTQAAGASSYVLHYDQSGKLQTIASVDSTSYTDRKLQQRTQYCYVVTAITACADGSTLEGAPSNVACATTR